MNRDIGILTLRNSNSETVLCLAKWLRNTTTGSAYCSYCPATRYFFGRSDTIEETVADVQSHLFGLLCHRFIWGNLVHAGWVITDTSVVPPVFTDEEVINLAEKSYEMTISEPLIVELDVEVPNVLKPSYAKTSNK